MKTGRIKLLWVLLIILVGLTILIMASCKSAYFVQQNSEKKESTDIIPRAVYVSDSINTPFEGKEYFDKGLEYVRLENYGEALPYFTKAIGTNPDFACAYYFRGLIKVELKQIDNACIDLNRAGELGIIEAYKTVKKIRSYRFMQQMIINL